MARQTPTDAITAVRVEQSKQSRYEMIRKLVIEHRRIDILCEYVLGGDEPMWFHYDMMEFQQDHDEGMILGFPGVRKTQYCTIFKAIEEILCDGNVRMLFVAESADQAKTFLRGVKSHFESNEELKTIFGDYVVGAERWADTEIIVNRRTAVGLKEATIMVAGRETSLVGRHFDVIFADDLVTEDTAGTEGQRAKTLNYFYKTLLPRLEPGGKMWVIGSRWHEQDLYGHLAKADYADATYTLPVLDEESDESVWEDKFPTKRLHRMRAGSVEAFELQWMCRAGVGVGGIFNENHFEYYDQLPASFFKWQGADLAIGQKARNDFFAHITAVVCKVTKDLFVVSFREAKLTFPRQVKFINDRWEEHPDTVRVGLEANSYQIALTQQVREDYPDIPVHPVYTLRDKVARAQQIAQIATHRPIRILRQHHRLLRRFCAFPNGPKDLFDAFDVTATMGWRGVRKKRRGMEPGLI